MSDEQAITLLCAPRRLGWISRGRCLGWHEPRLAPAVALRDLVCFAEAHDRTTTRRRSLGPGDRAGSVAARLTCRSAMSSQGQGPATRPLSPGGRAASLYPGVTVMLARVVLGEQL